MSLTLPAGRRAENLCARCAELDVATLITTPSYQHAQQNWPATKFEVDRSVYIDNFSLREIHSSRTYCHMCQLLAECARMTGDEKSLEGKYACIRPKLAWTKRPIATEGTTADQAATAQLTHTGQLYVWFHERKDNPKFRRQARRLAGQIPDGGGRLAGQTPNDGGDTSDSSDGMGYRSSGMRRGTGRAGGSTSSGQREQQDGNGNDAIIQSAVGSWRVDIMGKAFDGHRVIIGPCIDCTLLRSWFRSCVEGHNHTVVSKTTRTRLAKIRAQGLLRAISTITGELGCPGPEEPFAALSYVWGSTSSYTSSYRHSQRRGGLQALAPTLRDAAHLAQAVGIDWLWVDRVCINQADDTEKAVLIPYIKDVFAGAELTIVAANGDGAHTGLHGSPDTPRAQERAFSFGTWCTDADVSLAPATHSFNTLNDASTWHSRGWTFEEYVFSRRLLYIFPTESIFTCSTGTFRESTGQHFVPEAAGSTWGEAGSVPPSMASQLQARFNSRDEGYTGSLSLSDYIRAIEEYTARELSVEEDRISAFAGLVAAAVGAREHGPAEQALLGHGSPLHCFEALLTWQHVLQYNAQGPNAKQRVRQPLSGKPFAPSWCWAAAGMKVHFLDRDSSERGRVGWFDFSSLDEGHILGLPRLAMIRELCERWHVGSPATINRIVDEKPWARVLAWSSYSTRDGQGQASASDFPPPYPATARHSRLFPAKAVPTPQTRPLASLHLMPKDIPQLHIVTVVFSAYLYREADDTKKYILHQSGYEKEAYPATITEHWAVPPNNEGTSRLSSWRVLARRRQKKHERHHSGVIPTGYKAQKLGLFCIIAGLGHVYIMALEEIDLSAPPSSSSDSGAADKKDLIAMRLGLCRVSQMSDQSSLQQIVSAGGGSWRHVCIV